MIGVGRAVDVAVIAPPLDALHEPERIAPDDRRGLRENPKVDAAHAGDDSGRSNGLRAGRGRGSGLRRDGGRQGEEQRQSEGADKDSRPTQARTHPTFVLILRLLPTAVPLSKSINTKFHFFIPSL